MIDIRCRKCNRFLGSVNGSADLTLKCANCKALEHYRIISLASYAGYQAHEAQTKDAPTTTTEATWNA